MVPLSYQSARRTATTLLLRLGRVFAALFFAVTSLVVVFVLASRVPYADWVYRVIEAGTRKQILQTLLLILVLSVGIIYTGAISFRLLARALPLRANLRANIAAIVFLLAAIMLCLSSLGYLVWTLPDTGGSNYGDMDTYMAVAAGIGFLYDIVMRVIILASIVAVLPLLVSLWRHLRRPPMAGVLFLRRFGNRADTCLMAALLRIVPPGTSVAFIASPGSSPTSWDPITLVLAGFRWRRPWANVPLYLRSRGPAWERDVFHWIQRAGAVVFDASDFSESLAIEWRMIEKAGAQSRTVVAYRNGGTLPTQSPQALSGLASQKVPYEFSWAMAVPRIAVGSGVAAAAGFVAFGWMGATAAALAAALPLFHPSLSPASARSLSSALAAQGVLPSGGRIKLTMAHPRP